jgi:hypothetical protein
LVSRLIRRAHAETDLTGAISIEVPQITCSLGHQSMAGRFVIRRTALSLARIVSGPHHTPDAHPGAPGAACAVGPCG